MIVAAKILLAWQGIVHFVTILYRIYFLILFSDLLILNDFFFLTGLKLKLTNCIRNDVLNLIDSELFLTQGLFEELRDG